MEEESHSQRESMAAGFTDEADICQQLLDRYGNSSAPQHRHLCATAAAARAIIQSEHLPLSPLSYFAATIHAISETSETQDANAASALSSFLSIVLSLVPEKSIAQPKAAEAISVLVEMLENTGKMVSVSSVRSLVKCLGVLLGFCDLDDWQSVNLGFKSLLKFSIDKRPKVRKCAQESILKTFKSFQSSVVKQKASKLVLSLVKTHRPFATESSPSKSIHESSDDILSKSEHVEVLHVLNVFKLLAPYMSVKAKSKAVTEMEKVISSKCSGLTGHAVDVFDVVLQLVGDDGTFQEAANMIVTLASYISVKEHPVEAVLSATTLLEKLTSKVCVGEPSRWIDHLSLVIDSIAGLLTSEITASQASNVLKDLINNYFDKNSFLRVGKELGDDEDASSMDSRIIKSASDVFLNLLSACGGAPNEHLLAVVSVLFLKIGGVSYVHMKDIVVKLADFMAVAPADSSETKFVQECVGSVVVAMGPEKLLALLPISLNPKDLTCSNTWLLPILKNSVFRSSLRFFMDHVVPLAESFERAGKKVKMSVIGEDLQANARACWGLLPAFCRYPNDTYKSFGSLAKLLVPFLKVDSPVLDDIAIALQVLVNQNSGVLVSDQGIGEVSKLSKMSEGRDPEKESEERLSYSEKAAAKNIRALASCSEELLQALRDVLFESLPEKRKSLKDTIKCLASIADPSVIKKIFITSFERFELLNAVGCGMMEDSVDKEKTTSSTEKDGKRSILLELASSIIGSTGEDLFDQVYCLIHQSLLKADGIIDCEAYATLKKVLEGSSSFCSSKFVELIDLLLGLKSPVDVTSLEYRFTCFRSLLLYIIEGNLDGENTRAFLILNEIILTLKDSKEEGRKVAYDTLLGMCSSLQKSSCGMPNGPYQNFVSMIMGYLSGSSPHIKSGAVTALAIVVYNDTYICCLVPDLVPAILELLHSKAIEVIKAVLGFVKVVVLSLLVKDLLSYQSDIVNGVLPWSSVSRHHFRSKVVVIMEIMMRRCGSAAIKPLVPDKYKDFVKSVLENRHGKTGLKESPTTESEPKLSDSTSKWLRKRKWKELGNASKEELTKHPKRNRGDKRRIYNSKEPRKSSPSGNADARKNEAKSTRSNKFNRRHSRRVKRTAEQKFGDHHWGEEERTNGWQRGKRRREADATIVGNSSFPKHKKFGKMAVS